MYVIELIQSLANLLMDFYTEKANQAFSYKLCQSLLFRSLPFAGQKGDGGTMLFPSWVPEVIES